MSLSSSSILEYLTFSTGLHVDETIYRPITEYIAIVQEAINFRDDVIQVRLPKSIDSACDHRWKGILRESFSRILYQCASRVRFTADGCNWRANVGFG